MGDVHIWRLMFINMNSQKCSEYNDRQPRPHGAVAWYVAETLPRAETQAEQHLFRQGFSTLCPRFRKLRRHARRTEQVLTPLFPGYVFVRFNPQRDAWRAINGTIGIRRLVGAGTRSLQPVPADVMEALLDRCDQGVVSCTLPDIKPGREVRIISGPFADLLATITSLDDRGRARVLLDMLGNRTAVRIPLAQIGPV